MENLPQLVPLVILIPAIGTIINLYWGSRLDERWSGIIGVAASILAFVVALFLWIYLAGTYQEAAIVDPPILVGWLRIESIGLEIPWQQRVDTLSVTMMLVVTGVGSLIHIYATGYMHGDPKFPRFFAYLNLFLFFMLILVTGNNFLMMFVGWEGVGLCSYLLIGFWWDKKAPEGWKNSNAARKAFIVNRIGDFGLLMALFLVFTTFGTLDFFKHDEVINPEHAEHVLHQIEGEELGIADESEAGGEVSTEGEQEETAATEAESDTAAEGEHAAEEEHLVIRTSNDDLASDQLGIFGQAERLLALDENDPGRVFTLGPLEMDIQTVIVLVTLFMLLGAAGKSAQIPLFIWLPDAMAGPTPVSALIHAATMVTAGVYMMVRANVFYDAAAFTSLIVALIGASTAIVAGFIAMGQWDIKRVLAYSTISQLGFMVAAVGVGAFSAAMFHLVTHAFFKALLFLGSGSIIHGMEHGAHETGDHVDAQDMRHMGGLKNKMPITYRTYVIGTLALSGIFPLAGFWSKDEILGESWNAGLFGNDLGGFLALGVLLGAAAFTAFYMWRQVELVFHGEPRSKAADHAHESAPSMTRVLSILAFFSIFAGFFNTPKGAPFSLQSIFGTENFTLWLEASVRHVFPVAERGGQFNYLIAGIALLLGVGAILVARSIYGHGHALTDDGRDPLARNPATGTIWGLAHARLYWDEVYFRLFENPFNRLSVFLADTLDWAFLHDYVHDSVLKNGFNTIGGLLSRPFDLGIIDGIVNGTGTFVQWISGRLRRVQTGYVRTYAIALLLGVVAVLVVMLLPMLQNG